LGRNELEDENTGYMMKIFAKCCPHSPARIGVDNNHPYAHCDFPGYTKGVKIPVERFQTLGEVGSVVSGKTLGDDELRTNLTRYWEEF